MKNGFNIVEPLHALNLLEKWWTYI